MAETFKIYSSTASGNTIYAVVQDEAKLPHDGDVEQFPNVEPWEYWKDLPEEKDGEFLTSVSGGAVQDAIELRGYWIGARRGRIRVG